MLYRGRLMAPKNEAVPLYVGENKLYVMNALSISKH